MARQISVKATYGLWVTQAEHDAMTRILTACPDERATASVFAPPPDSAYYKNCDAARAAGAAPVHTGDDGYGRYLDRDGDGVGVGCES